MHKASLKAAGTCEINSLHYHVFQHKSRLFSRRSRCRVAHGLFRDVLASSVWCRGRQTRGLPITPAAKAAILASTSGGPQRGATATAVSQRRTSKPTKSPAPGPGGNNRKNNDPDDDPEDANGESIQIGVDPLSQQLVVSALTASAAWAIAALAHLDLSNALRFDFEAVGLALQLSAPVLVLLLAVVVPRWAPPFKGSELERLRHNYYMTAQVLQLYLDPDDDDEDSSSGDSGSSSSSWDEGSSSSDERARVRRRLRLEQTVGWGTISSGLALMQAYTLQPWNPPTSNNVFLLGLAGRSAQQLANEFLVRGAWWGLLAGWVAAELQSADATDGILFFGKVFGGPDAGKYAAGLALVALALPGALWEARSAKNFVRASVVGPVRDAAIFCTGNGVDEPSYCDPRGFALLAARRPANAAPVADVVTRTRSWRSGPDASYSSISSMGSIDMADLPPEAEALTGERYVPTRPESSATASAPAVTTFTGNESTSAAAASASPPSAPAHRPSPAHSSPPSPEAESSASAPSAFPLSPSPSQQSTAASTATAASPPPHSPSSHLHLQSPSSPAAAPPSPAAALSASSASSASSSPSSSLPASSSASASSPSSSAASSSRTPPVGRVPQLGPTLSPSSAAFEWDSEDMAVLLRVETLQDKIAQWSSLYYQLLVAFAINGAFLASECNLLASFTAAWLLRTGPLLLAELRARAAADAGRRSSAPQ